MGKSLADMTAEIREVNVAHGWRSAEGGPGANTFGDYLALLHSELSEALEAYRDHRLADATLLKCGDPICPDFGDPSFGEGTCPSEHATLPKPEGVGSELADVLIRLLDMCDVFSIVPFDMDCELADVDPADSETRHLVSFGDWCASLHKVISQFGDTTTKRTREKLAPYALRRLVAMAKRHGIDLTAEYERKIAYNRTRPYQHGGRTLAGEKGSA
jgi:NTP pyrophosphatase (non-canonical NTP hydrolase)